MCRVLKVSESGYYRWLRNQGKQTGRQLLLVKIKEIVKEHPDNHNYGVDRILLALLQKGIDKDEIYKKVYYTYSESRMRLVGYCLSEKMKIYPEYKTALIWLSREEMDKFECKTGDTEGIVNMPFSINGIVFCAFIRDDRELKKVKISFRSIGKFPANKVASDFFNGGGHLNAAGGESMQ